MIKSIFKSRSRGSGLTTSRVEAFSDGVFAIAITLLVLEIKVPEVSEALVSQQLTQELLKLFPKYASYVLSFLVIGVYWVGHDAMFHHINRSDRILMWLNLLFLMCIAFIPFPTALLGDYSNQQISVLIYGGTLIVTNFVFLLLFRYGTSNQRLVDDNISPNYVRLVKKKNLILPTIYALAIALSFLNTKVSILLFVLVPMLYVFPSRSDRYWKVPQESESD